MKTWPLSVATDASSLAALTAFAWDDPNPSEEGERDILLAIKRAHEQVAQLRTAGQIVWLS
jgi:hypothetical protein